jgi:ATP-dependent DNA ligase
MPYFYAFDLPWLNGRDLRKLSLIRRKDRLKKLVMRSKNPALLFADHVDEYGTDFFRMICERNLEGIVAKHRESQYSASAKWIKIKNPAYTHYSKRSVKQSAEESTRFRADRFCRAGKGERFWSDVENVTSIESFHHL